MPPSTTISQLDQAVPQPFSWEWPDLDWLGPLIQDTFLGRSRSPSPLPFVKPPSVVFVGPEKDINGEFGEDVMGMDHTYPDFQDNSTQAWVEDAMHMDNMHISEDQHVLSSMDAVDGFMNNIPACTSTVSSHQSMEPTNFDQYSYPSPGSTYSTSHLSIASFQTASSQSRDEILEEIHRECAEIERLSHSPPTHHQPNHKPRRRVAKAGNRSNRSHRSHKAKNSTSDRKKELNRIAATKYREKKRREREELSTEQGELEARREHLLKTAQELRTELAYLRRLVKDMEARSGDV